MNELESHIRSNYLRNGIKETCQQMKSIKFFVPQFWEEEGATNLLPIQLVSLVLLSTLVEADFH